jgi:hypothetical protein
MRTLADPDGSMILLVNCEQLLIYYRVRTNLTHTDTKTVTSTSQTRKKTQVCDECIYLSVEFFFGRSRSVGSSATVGTHKKTCKWGRLHFYLSTFATVRRICTYRKTVFALQHVPPSIARNIKPRNSGFLLRIAIHIIGRGSFRTEENVIEARMVLFAGSWR